MLYNSISVDMKVYALQPKQRSTAGVFYGILRNFTRATFYNAFGKRLLKKTTEEQKGAQ